MLLTAAHEELYEFVRSIPSGRVVSYGDLGAALIHPISGFLAGRWMRFVPQGVPWWRVVAKDGSFPVSKIDPVLGLRQEQLLKQEGVALDEEMKVIMSKAQHRL